MEFQSFLNSTKKLIEIKCFYVLIFYLLPSFFFFWDFTFYQEALYFITFIPSLCSNTFTLESIFEYVRQKLIKNMRILKFHPGMKCLHIFFSFFHHGLKSHLCFSSPDEISSRQKRVNSKRHFTIDRDDFIPGRVSSRDEISSVNTLLNIELTWITRDSTTIRIVFFLPLRYLSGG